MTSSARVRLSVDITPDEHRHLIEVGNRLASDLRVPRVHNQEIMSSLLRLMLTDAALIDRARAEVVRHREQTRRPGAGGPSHNLT